MRRITLDRDNVLGYGEYATVYAVGNKAVKVDNTARHNPEIREDSAQLMQMVKGEMYREYSLCKKLYDRGISVPKPYGVFRVELDDKRTIGFVMDRINGETLMYYKAHKSNEKEAKIFAEKIKEMQEEIKKASDLGFLLDDRTENNAMVDEEKNRVVLIDFGGRLY